MDVFASLIFFATFLLLGYSEQQNLVTLTTTASSVHFKNSSFPPNRPHDLALDILHRAALSGNNSNDDNDPLTATIAALDRDESRLRWIHHRITGTAAHGPRGRHRRRSLLQTTAVSSGLSLGNGEYLARLSIGTPPRSLYLELDTGSDLSWIQCSPCSSCYPQIDPIYDPSNSSSYRRVYCGAALCRALDYSACQGMGCSYRVVYGDSSSSSGDLAVESFSLASTAAGPIWNIAFGCGHSNDGLFRGQAGLLGMGGGELSFFSQIAATSAITAPAFSYCLVDRFSQLQASAPLIFGRTAIPFAARFTPLLRNPRIGTFYYAALIGISVGGTPLGIPPEEFGLAANGTGGVILDSGTTVTRVVSAAYDALRDAYRAASRNLPPAPRVYLLDTCYDFRGLPTVQIPSLVLHFDNGVDMALPGGNILIPVDRAGTFCLAFAPSSIPISVIGNVQQQTFRIGFDLQRSLIALAPREC